MTGFSAQTTARIVVLALLVALAPLGFATESTIAELQRAGRLQVDAALTPEGSVVPGQKITLTLRIATDRWFAGGTRISLPEVPGLVLLQTEQFASNSSERRGSENWVIQRWTIDVYPQRVGDFTIGAITARLEVNAGEIGVVEGAVTSPPVHFTTAIPASLADVGQWVAAPAFSVSQRFDRSLENLQVGEAFEREVIFEASDLMAMMLPSLAAQKIAGLAIYPAPPELENNNNRGQTEATRRQQISYVVQAEGLYRLPAEDFFWWDTSRGELQLVSLPATEITVGSGMVSTDDGRTEALPVTRRQLVIGGAGLLLLSALLWLGWRYMPRIPSGRLTSAVSALRKRIEKLRQPALAERLNPGGSAGE